MLDIFFSFTGTGEEAREVQEQGREEELLGGQTGTDEARAASQPEEVLPGKAGQSGLSTPRFGGTAPFARYKRIR